MKNQGRIITFLISILICCCVAKGQTISGTVNSYYHITAVDAASNTVTVDDATGLAAGQRVLLHQAKGAGIYSGDDANYGNITAINNAGGYEFNTICSITGNTIWLLNQMVNPYAPAGQVQLVTVVSGASITVSATVTGAAWDPTTGKGGIVALEATGSITLNADIDVSGLGFRGGALVNYNSCDWFYTASDYYYSLAGSGDATGGRKGEGVTATIVNQECGRGKLANGGGGGNNAETGGGGGANYGVGGLGGKRTNETLGKCHGPNPGIGGTGLGGYGYSVAANKVFFGGGGGGGWENDGVSTPGGNGGGIIILSAPSIIGGGGQLLATGTQGYNSILNIAGHSPYIAEGDGGGGGGAGGSIILNSSAVSGAITANAQGAQGSNSSNHTSDCMGPGGGGGGGTVWAAGASFPAAVSAVVSGGANGVVFGTTGPCVGSANSATSGTAGQALTGYVLPVGTGPVCTTLAVSPLEYFNAVRTEQGVVLSWAFTLPATGFVIQRSTDISHFDSVATVGALQDLTVYSYTDGEAPAAEALAYRLAWKSAGGGWSYSRIVVVPGRPGPDGGSMRVFPNPATDQVTVAVNSTAAGGASLTIANALGQSLFVIPVTLHSGVNTITLPVDRLATGTYFLILKYNERKMVRAFLKKKK